MKLYFVTRRDIDGENREVFANADSPEDAVEYAEAYFAEIALLGPEDYADAPWHVYEPPTRKKNPGVIGWGDVASHEIRAPAPAPKV